MTTYQIHPHGNDTATITNEFGTIIGTVYNDQQITFRDQHATISTTVNIDKFTADKLQQWAATNLPELLD